MILTGSEDVFLEERCVALKTLHRSEGSEWLGRDLRQVVNRGKVGAREGPMHSEELFHLLRTVIQGDAPSHAMQFAQRLRDTADEELVTPLENFVAAAYREPDSAEELDRADDAAETEVDEEIPAPHSNDYC